MKKIFFIFTYFLTTSLFPTNILHNKIKSISSLQEMNKYDNLGCLTPEDIENLLQLDEKLKKDPNNINYLLNKGFILHDGCVDDQAIEIFKKILKIEPKNEKAHIWLLESMWMWGDAEKLKELSLQAIKIYPKNAVFYLYLTYALEFFCLPETDVCLNEIITYLKKAIQLEPTWLSTRISLIDNLIKLKKFDEAKNEINEAFKQIQDNFPEPKDEMQKHYEELITGRLGAESSRKTLNELLEKINNLEP